MMRATALGLLAAIFPAVPALAGKLPGKIGACAPARITEIGTRLEGALDSGTTVSFDNGGYQVSYDREPAILASRIGDKVRICLVELPEGCPPGDERGKRYRTTNLRTKKSWELPDAEHACGGA